MKLKRLDIAGFKSFVDKTSLDFKQNVTAVVGPNGCGKSNIVDAIRWVMGEQSPKNLRGRNMEDVIFGGSQSRKPVGMAEVSLVFSTEDGRVSAKYLNYSEIQVTRRLYRSGESEYLLNKTPCRLLDIAELFMDTGAGAKAYSIIEQGKIGMILHSKPEERRFLVEEAAGVVKYKSRKQIALKKIDVTRQNLIRIGDIVAEIRRQLNALQRQAKKAEKFREYREELKEIDLFFAAGSYRSIESEKKRIEEERAVCSDRLGALVIELERAELALEEKKIAALENEKSLASRQDVLYRIKGDIQGTENRLEFQKKELMTLDRHLLRFAEDVHSLQRQLADAEAELKSLTASKETLVSDIEGEQARLFEAERELEEVSGHERQLVRRLEDIRRELLSVLSEMAKFNNQHANAIKRLEVLEESVERNNREVTNLREKLIEANSTAHNLEAVQRVLAAQKEEVAEELGGLKSRSAHIRERLEEISRKLQAKRELLGKKGSRLHSLQELEAQFAGYGQGIRSIFLTDRFQGVFRGVLADFVEVDEMYEMALETVLGERLQYVLCNSEAEALKAVDYLKETSSGRCSFIVQGVTAAARCEADGRERLLDKVSASDGYGNLITALLENVFIADDLPTAFSLGRLHPQLTFVTPGGDLVHAGGIIHGGSTEAVRQGLVHKKREIKVLVSEVAILADEVKVLESHAGQLGAELAEIDDKLKDLRNDQHQLEIRLLNNDKDLLRALEECRRIEERIAIKGLEDDQLGEEKVSLDGERAFSDQQRAACDCRKGELESEIEELQEMLRSRKTEIEKSRETVTGLKVRAASLKEKRESNLRAMTRVENRMKELGAQAVKQKMELERSGQDKEKLSAAITLSDEEMKSLLVNLSEAEALFSSERVKYEAGACQVREAEAHLKELRFAVEELRKSASEKNVRFSELCVRLQHMVDSLRDKYRMEIESVLSTYADVDWDEAEKSTRQAELRKLVDDMGEVNLMAIEEFRELEERHNFLSSQKADLEESLQSLQQAIQRINRTTRKRFHETFVKINEKFQEIFPRLFCGGTAELKLTDEEDLLETGIDVIVQPPGKKLQNISLLSGGEKALTAVALMFSIFLIKPTPFCLLDEVDAPLDEANIRRFSEMIKELSETSQFIMITHNKATMACADCLYGVTMEEPGVSRLVSVKLH